MNSGGANNYSNQASFRDYDKIREVLDYVKHRYVDTIDHKKMTQSVIKNFLKDLDPHSVYVPKDEFLSSLENMQGAFDGIGIVFSILNDTILVVNAINGGPSEKLGLMSGDKIIMVDDSLVAGVGVTDNDVMKMLRGTRGTIVKVGIKRSGESKLIDFNITRDKIPIYSVDAHYMINSNVGYIKISRFSRETFNEFKKALYALKQEGMQHLVLDLMNNSGGYLGVAVQIVDEFLGGDKMIVYTEGVQQQKREYRATEKGGFENGDLVVLVDEGAASASEILAGAIQDWDRGSIVGRRTFGKGLVQEQYVFNDSSALRLTVARYYTPLGRCIQKPYDNGRNAYYQEYYNRFLSGEVYSKDSIKLNDSIRFVTPGGKVVYGGGGIVPDYFVSIDTTGSTSLYRELRRKRLIDKFSYNYVSKHRKNLLDKYANAIDFSESISESTVILRSFKKYLIQEKVNFKTLEWQKSKDWIGGSINAKIAQQCWGANAFFEVFNKTNPAYVKALDILNVSDSKN